MKKFIVFTLMIIGMTSFPVYATETENRVILALITLVPISIISIGIVVWIARRRKK